MLYLYEVSQNSVSHQEEEGMVDGVTHRWAVCKAADGTRPLILTNKSGCFLMTVRDMSSCVFSDQTESFSTTVWDMSSCVFSDQTVAFLTTVWDMSKSCSATMLTLLTQNLSVGASMKEV